MQGNSMTRVQKVELQFVDKIERNLRFLEAWAIRELGAGSGTSAYYDFLSGCLSGWRKPCPRERAHVTLALEQGPLFLQIQSASDCHPHIQEPNGHQGTLIGPLLIGFLCFPKPCWIRPWAQMCQTAGSSLVSRR